MKITINGSEGTFDQPTTVRELIAALAPDAHVFRTSARPAERLTCPARRYKQGNNPGPARKKRQKTAWEVQS